ncbi:hypothetical protein [uncultured Proteiniphilum sp.]|uniref:hypothetical protein n=1 Tax=uncultured Proteiniphilum sp. TaxID=497637 RepID=UPI00260789F8|nr:hypothetical protein [uncultured Proteiniphilum sp.]
MKSNKITRISFFTPVSSGTVATAIASLLVGYCLFFSSCGSTEKLSEDTFKFSPEQRMVLGTYAGLPKLSNGRADLDKLIEQLKDLNANTYNWLIWQNENDWDDLKLFLPMALKNRIAVWVSLVPPSESKPKAKWNSEPFGTDYIRWSEEIAKLSVNYPNLVAFSIDDFVHNLTFYTPEYVKKMMNEIDKINPSLQFIPCSYYRQITADFAQKYAPLLDGILFPYRAESEGGNLQNAELVEQEIAKLRSLFKGQMPIYIDVYLTAHSRLGASTPSYVEEVIRSGREHADGVLIYKHPDPVNDAEKYQIVKTGFVNN